MKKIWCFLLFLCLWGASFGQNKESEKDSTDIYEKIETYSKKSKFTRFLHRSIFRSQHTHKSSSKKVIPSYKQYRGKIIRNIEIRSQDPFGHSVTDTTRTPSNWAERTGNALHVRSKELAIRNFLLLKENQPLDTFLIAESARLLRSQNYIREVRIVPKPISNNKDSVDIVVITLDSWSLIPKGSYSSSQYRLGVRERNIVGTGHHLALDYSNRKSDGHGAVYSSYTVPNFKNTFVSGMVTYATDYDDHFEKSLSIDRPFYSPLTRWAGGLLLEQKYLGRFFPDDSVPMIDKNLKFFAQDYWGGHAFHLLKGNTEENRATNLIVSARSLIVNYSEQPPIKYDSIRYFSDERFFLASTGISSRRFIEDSYIFKDGITEDVPVGVVYSLTGGIQNKNHQNRFYLGAKAFYGNYFKWGFLSTKLEVGTFFNHSKTEQTAYSINLSYFSNLLHLGGDWKMRQFIKPQMVIGINRLHSVGDRLSLDDDPAFVSVYYDKEIQENAAIEGFSSIALGTKKYLLELQSQFYSPWELWGFRLNPFINVTAGILTGGNNSFGTEKIYSAIGVGCVVRNDYLVFDSFQFSLTYYPQIPGQGNGIFKTNSFTNEDFGFQDFQIGKPQPVNYK